MGGSSPADMFARVCITNKIQMGSGSVWISSGGGANGSISISQGSIEDGRSSFRVLSDSSSNFNAPSKRSIEMFSGSVRIFSCRLLNNLSIVFQSTIKMLGSSVRMLSCCRSNAHVAVS